MKIYQKLKDPKSCDGCIAWPQIFYQETKHKCKLGYEIKPIDTPKMLKKRRIMMVSKIKRPEMCIKERGE